MQMTRSQALCVLKAFQFLTASVWPTKKVQEKINKLSTIVSEQDVEIYIQEAQPAPTLRDDMRATLRHQGQINVVEDC